MRSKNRYLLVFVSIVGLCTVYSVITYYLLPEKNLPKDELSPSATQQTVLEHADHLSTKNPSGWYFATEAAGHRDETFNETSLPTIAQLTSRFLRKTKRSRYDRRGPADFHLKYILNRPERVAEFNFKQCRMSNCFDFSRCDPNGPLKVHILPPANNRAENDLFQITGESNIIHKRIIKFIKESKFYEPDASRACVFVLADDTLDRDPLSQSFRPELPNILNDLHQYGMNHLVFNLYSGSWPDYKENDFAGFALGAAIVAKASNSVAHHRPRFDISIPLFSYLHGTNNTQESVKQNKTQRSYLLTFKGKRYVVGSGSEARNSLYHLNNLKDVVLLTTCKHGKKWSELKDNRCSDQEELYNKYDFLDLMRESTFCLTPRGRRLGSFRFLEALGNRCVPIILSDGWVWPFEELVDWSGAAIQFNENLILQVSDLLRDIDFEQVERMRSLCTKLNEIYFSSVEKIVMTTLSIIEKRVRNQMKRSSS